MQSQDEPPRTSCSPLPTHSLDSPAWALLCCWHLCQHPDTGETGLAPGHFWGPQGEVAGPRRAKAGLGTHLPGEEHGI